MVVFAPVTPNAPPNKRSKPIPSPARRLHLIDADAKAPRSSFADEVRQGLSDTPKHLPCRFFYDRRGSQLFEQICELPEYYPTRAEHSILEKRSDEIAEHFDVPPSLVELGSGSCIKTQYIIEELLNQSDHVIYGPIDISRKMLKESATALLERYDDLEMVVADLLVEGEVVARATGPMEFGARALGNRSILADPTRNDVIRIINDMIKNRDFWMPFAPMMLDQCAGEYIINPKQITSPYMILSFDTHPQARNQITAAIHPYDSTARPQILEQSHNPDMYTLLQRFEEKTGRGAV